MACNACASNVDFYSNVVFFFIIGCKFPASRCQIALNQWSTSPCQTMNYGVLVSCCHLCLCFLARRHMLAGLHGQAGIRGVVRDSSNYAVQSMVANSNPCSVQIQQKNLRITSGKNCAETEKKLPACKHKIFPCRIASAAHFC